MTGVDLGVWIGLATLLVSVVGGTAEGTRRAKRHFRRVRQERLELKETRRRYEVLDQKHRQLLASGTVVFNMKAGIDRELEQLADRVGATAGAVFVPAPARDGSPPTELVFLSVFGDASKPLERQRVPIGASDAGQVYTMEKPLLTTSKDAGKSFSDETDRAAKFHTIGKASVPLVFGRKVIGVAQFLNKETTSQQFNHEDILLLMNERTPLATRVADFVANVDNLHKIGITPTAPMQTATVLFADITGSSDLMKQKGAAHTTDLLNEYFESLGTIALEFGGNIEQYFGDGFMVSFNARRKVDDHERQAVTTAREMQRCFEVLKQQWVAMRYCKPDAIYNRIGIGAGTITKAEIGHPQFKHLTIMGDCVNVAKKLCDGAKRDRSVVVVSEAVRQKLAPDALVDKHGDAYFVSPDWLVKPVA